ncbi:MAG: O-antigen ligase family protein [candidate division NC10 bacterium]|nr:O-antigen ligase family protein [candidate division NC10 bacterium]MDE2321938.1 O-antigen ligase family protein [candidate division NC10 bacterium]
MSQDHDTSTINMPSPADSPALSPWGVVKLRCTLIADRVVEVGLYGLIVFTPLAFGTVEPWSIALAEAEIYAIALAWGLPMVSTGHIRIERTALNLCWLLVLIFGLLQVIPLQLDVIRIISPNTAALYQRTGFDSHLVAPWHTLSLVPYATRQALVRLLALALLFWVTVNHLQTREQVDRIVRVVMATGFGLALFGIIQHFTGNGKLYWVRELTQGGSLFGPYVNRNHFAGYMEMVIPLTIGYIVANRRPRSDGRVPAPNGGVSWRSRLLRLGTPQGSRSLLAFFGGLIMFVALLLTGSRAGLFSFFSSILFMVVLLSARRLRSKRLWGMLASFVALGLAFALWLNPDRVLQTFAILWRGTDDPSFRGRILVWQDTLRLGHDFQWSGTGLDTYIWAFPLYKQPLIGQEVYDYAHNDYLQAFAEGGLPLVAIFALALLWGGTQLLNAWSEHERPHTRGIGLGLLAGLVAMLVHSAYDFNLHILANAILFVLLLALASRVLLLRCPRMSGLIR